MYHQQIFDELLLNFPLSLSEAFLLPKFEIPECLFQKLLVEFFKKIGKLNSSKKHDFSERYSIWKYLINFSNSNNSVKKTIIFLPLLSWNFTLNSKRFLEKSIKLGNFYEARKNKVRERYSFWEKKCEKSWFQNIMGH